MPPAEASAPTCFYRDDPDAHSAAQAVCRRCPVIEDCREAGQTEDWGIWGGTIAQERNAHRQPRQPGPAPITSDDQLTTLLSTADPDSPALDQILARLPVATSTAYRYLTQARRLGLVEPRNGRLHPTRR